jgi:hypothetical protein
MIEQNRWFFARVISLMQHPNSDGPCHRANTKLTLASGATALGSVLSVTFHALIFDDSSADCLLN